MSLAFVRRSTQRSLIAAALASAASAQIAGSNWQTEGNQAGALAGCSVASAGDVNRDGYDDVLVGARSYDGSFANEGRVQLFLGSMNGLVTSPMWTVLGGQVDRELGATVASAGDVNSDGYGDVLVYAEGYPTGQLDHGAAYLYLGNPTGLALAPAWTASGTQLNERFGSAITGVGDVDGDGWNDVVIGAPGFNSDSGSVSLFGGTPSGLWPAASWVFTGTSTSELGGAVAGLGDVSGDGMPDVAIGAQYYDPPGQPSTHDGGALFVFHGSTGGLPPSPSWSVSGPPGRGLGSAVASAGDVDADGDWDVIVGAQNYDVPGAANAGRAQLYLGTGSSLATTAAWFAVGTQPGEQFGASVAGIGYFDDDRYADVVVGSRFYGLGQAAEGAATIYRGTSTGLSSGPSAVIESNQAGAELGYPVASAGDVNRDGGDELLVGVPRYDGPEFDEGAALMFFGAEHVGVTYYVDANATPPGQGTQASPFAWIATDLPYVRHDDVFRVAPGSYGGLVIFGKDLTVLGVAGAATTTLSGAGFHASGSVVGLTDVTDRCHVIGFTIQNGGGRSDGVDVFGGGIYCANASARIEDCAIRSNTAVAENIVTFGGGYGGGVYADSTSHPLLLRCVIQGNWCYGTDEGPGAGGGVFGPATLEDCDVTGNFAVELGGGMAYATARNSRITANVVGWNPAQTAFGGGAAHSVLVDCELRDNAAVYQDPNYYWGDAYGGGAAGGSLTRCKLVGNRIEGIDIVGYSPDLAGGGAAFADLDHCEFVDNVVDAAGVNDGSSRGGGAFECMLDACVFKGNVADIGGGSNTTGNTVRCTFFGNVARVAGGACSGAAMVDSSILWGDIPNEVDPSAAPALSYCDVDDAALATGTNFQLDPRFWHPIVGDVHLRPGSPCIDAGNPTLPLDPDFSRADVGALAFELYYCSDPITYCTAKVNSLGCSPSIAASGQPSASNAQPCWITCSDVISQKTGIFFYGTSGRTSFPFQGGTMCVAGPLRRTPLQSSGGSASGADCTGVFAIDFSAWCASVADANLVQGAQVNGEYWYRDPQSPSTTGLSNAIELILCY